MTPARTTQNYWLNRVATENKESEKLARADKREDFLFHLTLAIGWILGVFIVLGKSWYAGWQAAEVDTMEIAFLSFFVVALWVRDKRLYGPIKLQRAIRRVAQ